MFHKQAHMLTHFVTREFYGFIFNLTIHSDKSLAHSSCSLCIHLNRAACHRHYKRNECMRCGRAIPLDSTEQRKMRISWPFINCL